MNKRYYVFLSLAVIIALGVLMDIFLVGDKTQQDEKIVAELTKQKFTNIRVFGKYRGAGCEKGSLKRNFQADQDDKVAYGTACVKDEKAFITVESLNNKPDPSKLSLN